MNRDEINTFLARTSFPDGCRQAELRETHISWLILTHQYVYKIKKEVKFSFLDFTSLRQRAYFCRREVLLNSRLTEGLYLAYLPVRFDGEQYFLGGEEGEIVDYAVQMRRIPDTDHFPRKLRHSRIRSIDMARLGNKIAAFHQDAPICNPVDPAGRIQKDFNDLEVIFPRLLNWSSLYRKALVAIRISDRFLERYGDRFAERATEGWYRDIHGDLHMGNIFIQKEPVIFDCIEFNDNLRRIDVLNEMAFLCMDLETHGYPEQSLHMLKAYQTTFNPWLKPLDDKLFLYYKMYRANVRLKVLVLSVPEGPLIPEIRRSVYRYAEAMYGYADRLGQSLSLPLQA